MANGPLAVAEFKQFVQVRVWVFCAQPKGEETTAEDSARPLPASKPPKVVEAVPPLNMERVELPVKADAPLPIIMSVKVLAPVPP